MNRLFTALLDLLYPPKCVFCGKLLKDQEKEAGLCGSCREGLPWVDAKTPPKVCAPAEGCIAPLWYREQARESFRRYKFEGRDFYAPVYGKLMARCVRERLEPGAYDLAVWAPLSAKRKKRRGYDQAELLARALSAELGIPAAAALRKTKDTPAQSSLDSDAARAANAAGAYEIADGELVRGKRVLLVDDIATSGATLSRCAQILLDAGAAQVWAAAFARARE